MSHEHDVGVPLASAPRPAADRGGIGVAVNNKRHREQKIRRGTIRAPGHALLERGGGNRREVDDPWTVSLRLEACDCLIPTAEQK